MFVRLRSLYMYTGQPMDKRYLFPADGNGFSFKEFRLLHKVGNPEKANTASETDESEKPNPANLQHRREMIRDFYTRFRAVTRHETGAASEQETNELMGWALSLSSEEEIEDKEKWMSDYKKRMESARKLYYMDFLPVIQEARRKNYISSASLDNWMKRFKDPHTSYKTKEYWIQHQFKGFLDNWRQTTEERERLLTDPALKNISPQQADVKKLLDEKAFLSLHYDKRSDLLAKVRAAILANEKNRGDLYMQAKSQLNKAVTRKVMSATKVGQWLERIFKSNASKTKIDEFLHGSSKSKCLSDLIQNWTDVKRRYDIMTDKIKMRGRSSARGLYVMSPEQFLNMHYDQRLKYVTELEYRLNDSKDVRDELPEFLKIRHALDMKDWDLAEEEMMEAEKLPLSDANRQRLGSMKDYLKRMRTDKVSAGKQSKSKMDEVSIATRTIDAELEDMPSNIRDMILELTTTGLSNIPPSVRLHQLRWIWYNNQWSRHHGYLNRKKMMQGASQENRNLTQYRGRHGIDIGRNDVVDETTAGAEFIRKDEHARNRATLIHLDTSSVAAKKELVKKLSCEQNTKVLYWMTLCPHDKGLPMSDNRNDDVLRGLTKIRSSLRTIEKAGYRYNGIGKRPVPYANGAILN